MIEGRREIGPESIYLTRSRSLFFISINHIQIRGYVRLSDRPSF